MAIPVIRSYPMPRVRELPENRVAWKPDVQRCALLIHDMQRYFIDFFPSGSPLVAELVANIAMIRRTCWQLAIPVFYSLQTGAQSPAERGLLLDFWGKGMGGNPDLTRVVQQLAPGKQDTLIHKRRYSAFHQTALHDELRSRERDQLIICGVYAHIGCLATALHAFMHDVQAFIVADAVADFSEEEHRMALGYAARRCAAISSTRELTAALDSTCGDTHEESDKHPWQPTVS
jgi:isochorismate hydrolase